MNSILSLICVFVFRVHALEQTYFLKEDFVNDINNVATTWKAGVNFHPNTPLKNILRLLGSKGVGAVSEGPLKSRDPLYVADDEIPEEFDARQEWKNCTSIGFVRDQGNCGSCWAFSTSEAFTDRLCIATGDQLNPLLSAEELTFCCYPCGFGCQGGYPIRAWKMFESSGLVTGGIYNSGEGCQPYTVPPCSSESCGPPEINHSCSRKCYGNTTINYRDDHRHTKNAYYLDSAATQKDIILYGPVESSFDVYDDFVSYKEGVYIMSPNATYLGGHSVKCIGWGVESKVPYWLMVNSWNTTWGDNGLFKIRRGTNECNVDNSFTAGVPDVKIE